MRITAFSGGNAVKENAAARKPRTPAAIVTAVKHTISNTEDPPSRKTPPANRPPDCAEDTVVGDEALSAPSNNALFHLFALASLRI